MRGAPCQRPAPHQAAVRGRRDSLPRPGRAALQDLPSRRGGLIEIRSHKLAASRSIVVMNEAVNSGPKQNQNAVEVVRHELENDLFTGSPLDRECLMVRKQMCDDRRCLMPDSHDHAVPATAGYYPPAILPAAIFALSVRTLRQG